MSVQKENTKSHQPECVIVEESQIPKKSEILDVPLDNPISVYKVCQQLEILCEKEQGLGVSAVQTGVPWKLFIIKGDGSCPLIPKGKYGYFVNCYYEATSKEQVVSFEGCLSLRSPDGRLRFFEVDRHNKIKIVGYKLNVNETLSFEKIETTLDIHSSGIVFQHEIDHHCGILISDIGREKIIH